MEHPASTLTAGDTPGLAVRVAKWISAIPRYRYFQFTILAVLAAAFVTSFSSGSSGAEKLGFPPEFLFTPPLICDIVAGLATLVHGWARTDASMRRLAAAFVMAPMLLSWAANAVDHVARKPRNPVWSELGQNAWLAGVILFAGLCPVAVAALLYFGTKFAEFERRLTEQEMGDVVTSEVPTIEAVDEPEFIEPQPIVTVTTRVPEVEVDDELVDEINEIEVAQVMRDEKVTRDIAEVMVRDGVSRATAYRRRGASNAALA